jgi:predicted nuclease of predicted toxin-antitoxin system
MFILLSVHVHRCGLGNADDSAIWQYAKDNGFTIVSKDSDFQERCILHGQPPKFIWLRAANSSTEEIENLLRTALPIIKRCFARSYSIRSLGGICAGHRGRDLQSLHGITGLGRKSWVSP